MPKEQEQNNLIACIVINASFTDCSNDFFFGGGLHLILKMIISNSVILLTESLIHDQKQIPYIYNILTHCLKSGLNPEDTKKEELTTFSQGLYQMYILLSI